MQLTKNKIYGVQQPGRLVHRYATSSQKYTEQTEYLLRYSTLNLLRSYDPITRRYLTDIQLPFQPETLAVSRTSCFAQCGHEAIIITEEGYQHQFEIPKASAYEAFLSEDGNVLVVCAGDDDRIIVTSYLNEGDGFVISKQYTLDAEDNILGNSSESSVIIFNQNHLFLFSPEPDVKSMFSVKDLFGGGIELNDVCADHDISHLYAISTENTIYKVALDTLSVVPETLVTLADDCFTIRVIDGLVFALSGHKLYSISVEDNQLVNAISDDNLRPFEIIDACHDVAYIHNDHDSYSIFEFGSDQVQVLDCIPNDYIDIRSTGDSYLVNFGDSIRKYDHDFKVYETMPVSSKCECIHSFGEDFVVCSNKSTLYITRISENKTFEIELPQNVYNIAFCPADNILLVANKSVCAVYNLEGQLVKKIEGFSTLPKISDSIITTYKDNILRLITYPTFDEVLFEFPDRILANYDHKDYSYLVTESNDRVSFNVFNKITMKCEFRANSNLEYLEDSDVVMSRFGNHFAFGFSGSQEVAYYVNGFLEHIEFDFDLTGLVWKNDEELLVLSNNAGVEYKFTYD